MEIRKIFNVQLFQHAYKFFRLTGRPHRKFVGAELMQPGYEIQQYGNEQLEWGKRSPKKIRPL